jgi:hypothetical protein
MPQVSFEQRQAALLLLRLYQKFPRALKLSYGQLILSNPQRRRRLSMVLPATFTHRTYRDDCSPDFFLARDRDRP